MSRILCRYLTVAMVLAASLSPVPTRPQQPGQGGYYQGSFRDYDSFYYNYERSGTPGIAPISPVPPAARFSPLAVPNLPAVPYTRPGGYGRPQATGWVTPWSYRASGKYYVATATADSGAAYYWVYWPSKKRFFYLYSLARERYAGLYDIALQLYRPYEAKAQRWGEATAPPVPQPAEPPGAAARRSPARTNGRPLPKPPAFRTAPAESSGSFGRGP